MHLSNVLIWQLMSDPFSYYSTCPWIANVFKLRSDQLFHWVGFASHNSQICPQSQINLKLHKSFIIHTISNQTNPIDFINHLQFRCHLAQLENIQCHMLLVLLYFFTHSAQDKWIQNWLSTVYPIFSLKNKIKEKREDIEKFSAWSIFKNLTKWQSNFLIPFFIRLRTLQHPLIYNYIVSNLIYLCGKHAQYQKLSIYK